MSRFAIFVRRIVAWAACLAIGCAAAASAMEPDPTGLWYNPDEAGWGMSLARQGDTLFVVMFVYDDAKRPAWYVASNVTFNGVTVLPAGEPIFTGTLYRTSGPWFGGSFDRNAVAITPVGDIQLTYVAAAAGKSLSVAYRIDGTQFFKTLQPQTWGDNRASLVGHFSGGVKFNPVSPAACPELTSFVNATLSTISISSSASSGKVDIAWGTGTDTSCVLSAPYQQRGQLGSVSGMLQCGPVPAPSDFGAMQVTGITVASTGFSASASLQHSGCGYSGTIGGVRQP